jgi:hypothetical protein
MSRQFTPKIVTANALIEGHVVYLRADDSWSSYHHEAEYLEDEAHADLRLLDAHRDGAIVGPYLANATKGVNGPVPVHFRDAFRATGPSNYPHGKQENTAHV